MDGLDCGLVVGLCAVGLMNFSLVALAKWIQCRDAERGMFNAIDGVLALSVLKRIGETAGVLRPRGAPGREAGQ